MTTINSNIKGSQLLNKFVSGANTAYSSNINSNVNSASGFYSKTNESHNDEITINNSSLQDKKKQGKKAKIAAVSLGIAATLTGIAALFKTKAANKLFKHIGKAFDKTIGSFIKNKVKGMKNAKAKETLEKIGANISGAGKKVVNITSNANNGKDVTFRGIIYSEKANKGILRFLSAPFRKLDEVTTAIYKKTGLNSTERAYAKASTRLSSLDEDTNAFLQKIISDKNLFTRTFEVNGQNITISDAVRLITEKTARRQNIMSEHFGSGAIGKRFSEIDASMMQSAGFEGIEAKTRRIMLDSLRGIKDKDNLRAFSNKLIAQDIVEELKRTWTHENPSKIKAIITNGKDGETEQILDILKALIKDNPTLQKEFNQKIASQSRLYSKSMGHAIKTETVDLIEKLRDVNCGGAPTDIMTLITSTGALGIYAAQADSKEERTSVVLNTGVPLITALLTSLTATTKMISGGKAIGLSFLTGAIAKVIGSAADNIYRKKHGTEDKETSIVTLDDYINGAKDITENLTDKFKDAE